MPSLQFDYSVWHIRLSLFGGIDKHTRPLHGARARDCAAFVHEITPGRIVEIGS